MRRFVFCLSFGNESADTFFKNGRKARLRDGEGTPFRFAGKT